MPRKASGNYDDVKYRAEWQKENMLNVSAKYSKAFVLEFREACKKLGIGTSDVIRKAMQDTIQQAKDR